MPQPYNGGSVVFASTFSCRGQSWTLPTIGIAAGND